MRPVLVSIRHGDQATCACRCTVYSIAMAGNDLLSITAGKQEPRLVYYQVFGLHIPSLIESKYHNMSVGNRLQLTGEQVSPRHYFMPFIYASAHVIQDIRASDPSPCSVLRCSDIFCMSLLAHI